MQQVHEPLDLISNVNLNSNKILAVVDAISRNERVFLFLFSTNSKKEAQ